MGFIEWDESAPPGARCMKLNAGRIKTKGSAIKGIARPPFHTFEV